jgi:hypothetical protein
MTRGAGEWRPFVWGAGMLAVTALGMVFDHRLLRGLAALAMILVVCRSLLAVWTLGFVRPGQRAVAVRARANVYVLGALAFVCAVTLLG